MEEKADKPNETTPRLAGRNGTVRSAALLYGSATRRGIPDRRSTTTLNYVLSEKFEIN